MKNLPGHLISHRHASEQVRENSSQFEPERLPGDRAPRLLAKAGGRQ